MNKTLHISDTSSWEGCMKFAMYDFRPKDSYDIMAFDYSFCTACLPKNLSKQELERCLKGTHTTLYNNLVMRFADIDLSSYNKIVIWHACDSNSLLLLYFFSTVVKGDLYHCRLETDEEKIYTGAASPNEIQTNFYKIQMLSKEERCLFNEIYSSLSKTEGIPKIADGYHIICKSKEFVMSLMMKHLTKTPKHYVRIVGDTIVEFPKEYLFDSMYLECLILEMIEMRKLKPLKIIRDNSKKPYPIGGFYNRTYHYKGEDMGKWYEFSVIKNQ